MRDLSVCLLSVLINKIRDLRKEISTVKRVAIKSVNLYKLLRKKKKKLRRRCFGYDICFGKREGCYKVLEIIC